MRRFVRLAVYMVIATWAGALVGDGREVQGASQDNGAKTAVIVVKSVKPEVSAGSGIVAYGLTRNDYHHIVTQIPNLRRTIPVREAARRARYRDRLLDVQLIGTTEAFAGAHAVEVARGRFLLGKDLKRLGNVAVISREAAGRLFLDEDPIGKSIRIDRSYFLVVGVVSKGSVLPNGEGSDRHGDADLQVFVPLSTMRARLGDVEIIRRGGSIEAERFELSRIEITVDDPERIETTAGAIKRMLQTFHEQPDYSVKVVR